MKSSDISHHQQSVTSTGDDIELFDVRLPSFTLFDEASLSGTGHMQVVVHMGTAQIEDFLADEALRREQLYLEMFSEGPLRYATPYLLDEYEQLLHCMQKLKTEASAQGEKAPTMVVVGAGPYLHLAVAEALQLDYVAVDPCINYHRKLYDFSQNERVSHHAVTLGELDESKLPQSPRVFVFPFNVMAYIENADTELKRLMRPGDSAFISSWNENPYSEYCHRMYQEALTAHGFGDDSLQNFELHAVRESNAERARYSSYLCGQVSDALFIQY